MYGGRIGGQLLFLFLPPVSAVEVHFQFWVFTFKRKKNPGQIRDRDQPVMIKFDKMDELWCNFLFLRSIHIWRLHFRVWKRAIWWAHFLWDPNPVCAKASSLCGTQLVMHRSKTEKRTEREEEESESVVDISLCIVVCVGWHNIST